jgi:hypothetical protein
MDNMLVSEHIITNLVLNKTSADEHLLVLEDDLSRTKMSLKESEDFNQRLKEENNSVKELFQREVKIYDEEAVKKSNIIKEYKLICSKLSSQLEEETKQSREKMSFFQSNLCDNCSAFVATALAIAANKQSNGETSGGSSERGSPSTSGSTPVPDTFEAQIQPLENELAKTKIALAEAECRNDDLNHRLILAQQDLESYKTHHQQSGAARIWKNLTFNKESRRSALSLEDTSVGGNPPTSISNPSSSIPFSTSAQNLARK